MNIEFRVLLRKPSQLFANPLVKKIGKLMPSDLADRAKTFEMLMLQMSGIGPNFGQLLVWAGPWENKFPQVTSRYSSEVSRLLAVLERHLDGQEYMAAGQYSIAFFPWIRMCHIHPVVQTLGAENFIGHSELLISTTDPL